MPAIGAPLRKWTLCLLLCSIPTYALAQATNETAAIEPSALASTALSVRGPSTALVPPKSSALSSFDSTCPFRTINYITHTLPQQCLRTGWAAPALNASVEGGGERAATPTADAVVSSANQGTESGVQATSEGAPGQGPQETGSSHAEAEHTTSTQSEAELETDSPLDNANFLSFEEWKKKNLARAGQSPENVGQGRASSSEQRARRRPVNVNALDSLGEEAEIEIDFSGFGGPAEGDAGPSGVASDTQDPETTAAVEEEDKMAPSSWALSKDAGKTCKERFNYASFDCAATVLKTNPKAKSSSSILVENKDSYMLNECSAQNKFIIVELCDDILVDTVVLANYEFFSSMFRHFRVSVSDRYPVKMDRWRVLGTFEARNTREIQPFLVTEPQIWARYLRIEFLTHYGNEFYCPMSLLRVHGTTMMEQFRREEEQARGDDDFAEPIEAVEGDPVQTAVSTEDGVGVLVDPVAGSSKDTAPLDTQPHKDAITKMADPAEGSNHAGNEVPQSPTSDQTSNEPPMDQSNASTHVSGQSSSSEQSPASSAVSSATGSDTPNSAPVSSGSGKEALMPVTSTSVSSPSRGSSVDSKLATPKSLKSVSTQSKDVRPSSDESTSVSSTAASGKVAANSTSSGSMAQSQPRGSSQTQPNPASPTTQESFFKSIHKRLLYLEANSTLSLQYIEEQSRILRDAFMKVEKKQLQKTEKFLDHLNSTVMQELKSYRNMYDQLWQSTILELEGMKERQKAEIGEIGARLSMVADELVWQKRMAVVQSTLLLLCLGLVLFVRSGTLGSQPDVPIIEQLGNTYASLFDSPPRSPEHPRNMRRRRTFRIWRSDTSALSDRSGHQSDGAIAASDAETDGRRSPVQIAFSPPTPITPGASSSGDKEPSSSPEMSNGTTVEDQNMGLLTPTEDGFDDQAKRIQVLETQSGPATPRGSRDSRPSWEEVDRAVDMLKAEEKGQGKQREPQARNERRKRRSPLRRAESYSEAASDSPEDEGAEGLLEF